jgi:hypothetical protein
MSLTGSCHGSVRPKEFWNRHRVVTKLTVTCYGYSTQIHRPSPPDATHAVLPKTVRGTHPAISLIKETDYS